MLEKKNVQLFYHFNCHFKILFYIEQYEIFFAGLIKILIKLDHHRVLLKK